MLLAAEVPRRFLERDPFPVFCWSSSFYTVDHYNFIVGRV